MIRVPKGTANDTRSRASAASDDRRSGRELESDELGHGSAIAGIAADVLVVVGSRGSPRGESIFWMVGFARVGVFRRQRSSPAHACAGLWDVMDQPRCWA